MSLNKEFNKNTLLGNLLEATRAQQNEVDTGAQIAELSRVQELARLGGQDLSPEFTTDSPSL